MPEVILNYTLAELSHGPVNCPALLFTPPPQIPIMSSTSNHPPVPHVLIVDPDDASRKSVETRLNEAGWTVDTVQTGLEALKFVDETVPDIVILDIVLSGLDGLDVCRTLRNQHPNIYILILSARADELDRVVGLEVGADDYVAKPFSMQELVARLRSALRRINSPGRASAKTAFGNTDTNITIGNIQIDGTKRAVMNGDRHVDLTVREYDLLLQLARNPDRPFTRKELLEVIWGEAYEGYYRTIDSHIQRLRTKLEDNPNQPQVIVTVWGIGYKFNSRHGGNR